MFFLCQLGFWLNTVLLRISRQTEVQTTHWLQQATLFGPAVYKDLSLPIE